MFKYERLLSKVRCCLLKQLIGTRVVVKFLDGQEIIGTLLKVTDDYIELDTGKSSPEIHFIAALKLIRPFEVKL